MFPPWSMAATQTGRDCVMYIPKIQEERWMEGGKGLRMKGGRKRERGQTGMCKFMYVYV